MKLKAIRHPEDAASAYPQRPLLLSAFTVAVLILAVISVIGLGASGAERYRAVSWSVVALVLLTVIGTHSEEVFGDETAINGSILVVLAGAGIAYAGGPFWVAAACGLVAGLHWHHIRDRAFRKLLVNTSFTATSAVAATEVARLLATAGPSIAAIFLSGLAAVMAYWLTDNVLVAIVLAIVDGRPIREHVRDLVRSETEVIPFALVGFICGYVSIAEGAWLGILGTASLLVVAEAFVFRSGGSIRWCCQWLIRLVPIGIACALFVTLDLGAVRGSAVVTAFAATALLGAGILDRIHSGYALFPLIMCVVGASVALPGDPPVGIALIVGSAASIGFTLRRREPRNRITVLSAALCVSLLVGGLILVLGSGVPSVGAALLLGSSAALVGLFAWHAIMGTTVLLDGGRSMASSVGSVLRGDAGLILASGLFGVGVGLVGNRLGVLGVVAAVILTVGGLLITLAVRGRADDDEPRLTGEELLDVLRSAVLELPASRLPD